MLLTFMRVYVFCDIDVIYFDYFSVFFASSNQQEGQNKKNNMAANIKII